ncbi:MAG: glycosyltransferase family 39 protein [Turicibacter sp.]
MNPGYFSHDEIAWGIKAASKSSLFDIDYYNIFHYNEFHYRPLNFNLWLLTSHYLFEFPQLYHFFVVLFGVLNSIIVYFFLQNEIGEKKAFLAALLSTIMPTIVFVNGWIGTIADIFWFMSCAISLLIHQRYRDEHNINALAIASSILFFTFSLMFKETAVVFPGVLFLYSVYSAKNRGSILEAYKNRSDVILFALSSIIVIAYLVIRFKFLFPSQGGGYGTSIGNISARIIEYFIYPFLFSNIEVHGMFSQHSHEEIFFAILMHLLLIIFLCKKDVFNYFFYISCYFVTSVPILILDMSLPHYIYASGFVIACAVSQIFFQNAVVKASSIILMLLLILHGVNVQRNYISTGVYQNNFTTTLYSILKSNSEKDCLYLIEPDVGSSSWIAVRAIAFRSFIDDVNINGKVFFNAGDIKNINYKNICILSLDMKGRVILNKKVYAND